MKCDTCNTENALINKVCRLCHDPLPPHCTQCGRITKVLQCYRGITMCPLCVADQVKQDKKNG